MSDELAEVRKAAAVSATAAARLREAVLAAYPTAKDRTALARAACVSRVTVYRWAKDAEAPPTDARRAIED